MTSWWRRVFDPPRSEVSAPGEERVTADVTAYAESQVWPGFRTRTDAVGSVAAYFADSTRPTDPALVVVVATAVDRVWQQREAVGATWSDPGDWGRLKRALAELERSGWVARARAWEQHARIETAVGATLVGCLRRHGLPVEWTGSHETRPFVALRDWRKPLLVGP